MLVLQVIDRLKRGGGAESLVYSFAKEARSFGIECHIVTIRDSDTALVEELSNEGIRVATFSGHRLVNPIRLWRIKRHIHSLNPDVVHTHLSGSTILGLVAARLTNTPAVVSLHNVKVKSDTHFYHGKLETWLMKNWSKHIIAVGERTFRAHRSKAGNTPMSVILNAVRKPQPVNQNEIQHVRERTFPGYVGQVVVTVGSLTEQKGYSNLIQTLAKVESDFRCMIIGDGPLREELTEQARSLGLQDKVIFMGLRSDVDRLLQVGNIYVSSSLWEGLPVATLEAMYAGLPIISTAVGDAETVLGDGTGVLVKAGDNDSLAREISNLLTDSQLRCEYSRKSLEKVEANYNIDAWMGQLMAVYNSAVG